MQNSNQPFDFGKYGKLAGALALCVLALVIVFAGYSVFDLFNARLGAAPAESALAVAASVGVSVAVLGLVLTTRHAPLRGLGAIVLIAWSIITLALVGLNSALRGGVLTVPTDLAAIGSVIAALLAALALIPALTLPLAAHDRAEYASAASAASKYMGFSSKLAAVGASTIASAYFGVSRGMNPVLAVFLGVVLESCFIWAYLSLARAHERRDRADMWTWRVAVSVFGLFIALVSVETVSTLAGIRVPVVSDLADAGGVVYTSAVGLAVALAVIAHLVSGATAGQPETRTQTGQLQAGQLASQPARPTPAQAGQPEPAQLPEYVPDAIRAGTNGHHAPGEAGAEPKSAG